MKKKTTAETVREVTKEVSKTAVKVSEKKNVAGKAVMNGLTEEQVEILKNKILDEKNNLIFKNVYESDEFNLSNEDRSDEVDQANADVNNASRLRFRNREVFYCKKLDEALRRLSAGEYGHCDECDSNISFQRLYARPTAEMCINCKEEAERDESNNFIDRQSKSLGKAINLVQSIA